MVGHAWGSYLVISVRLLAAVMLAVFCMLIEPVLVGAMELRVVINEVMWDGDEYIELYNTGDEPVPMNDWVLTRQQLNKEEKIIIKFGEKDVIGADSYFLIEKNEEATEVEADLVTSLTLLNSGELIELKDDAGKVVDRANEVDAEGWYAGENTDTGVAMERSDPAGDGGAAVSWHTSTGIVGGRDGTPGSKNSEPKVNTAPAAVISGVRDALAGEEVVWSASDSVDEDGDELSFVWLFGDGDSEVGEEAAHTYSSSGTYKILLTVSDEENEDEAEWKINIEEPDYSDEIVINEFLPNPVGSDTDNEFIELKNTGGELVDLEGWQLDDKDGGSKLYIIDKGMEISGSGIVVFNRSDTKLALNNGGDEVRLMNPLGAVVSLYTYNESVGEGLSYNRRDGGGYVLSTTVTRGETNVITEMEEEEDVDRDEESDDGEVMGASVKEIELKDIREEEVGEEIKATGVVSVPPGVFGKNYIYLAGSGAQVYFSKGDYPDLRLGDTVEVVGTVSSVRGETRIKLALATDITKINGGDAPAPHVLETGEINEGVEGWLVTVQGEVTETSGATFYIDDGSGEIKIYIKPTTGINKPKMKKGDAVTITGVVSETSSGYRVLPRFQEDVRIGMVAGLTSFPATGLRHQSSLKLWPTKGYGPQAGQLGGWQESLRLMGVSLGLVAVLLIMARDQREPLLVGSK